MLLFKSTESGIKPDNAKMSLGEAKREKVVRKAQLKDRLLSTFQKGECFLVALSTTF